MSTAPIRIGRMDGMTMAKIAITVPEVLLSDVRRAVRRGRSASVSAYITDAVAERVKLDDLARLLSEMLAETGGPLTASEKRAADAALGVRTRRKRRAA